MLYLYNILNLFLILFIFFVWKDNCLLSNLPFIIINNFFYFFIFNFIFHHNFPHFFSFTCLLFFYSNQIINLILFFNLMLQSGLVFLFFFFFLFQFCKKILQSFFCSYFKFNFWLPSKFSPIVFDIIFLPPRHLDFRLHNFMSCHFCFIN